ncbi:MAG: uroporphyrinogen decarboxylase family protein [Anaerolineae bacterium]|jgi:uroporphyrinogen decarboxylase
MNHRQRVLAALRHQEPDRVPVDFGGTVDSTISALSYQALRRALDLPPTLTRVQDVYQYTAVVEDDVRRALGVDTAPVLDQPAEWRPGSLPDGTPGRFPARFRPETRPDGAQVVTDGAGTVLLKMPAGGHYFDPLHAPLAGAESVAEIDRCQAWIESYDRPDHLDLAYEELAAAARALRQNSDYLLVGFFGGHIFQAAQSLRGWEQFLVDLLRNQSFARALLDRLAEANVRRFAHYAETVGRYVDVIHFEDDLGMQDRPLLRPALYRRMVKPYHARLFAFARAKSEAVLLFHSDGAVAPLIPDFIEMGIDALNPMQVSAAGMDPLVLKREFGREMAFWGGACDSQETLPFGTPAQVADEVRRRIDALAPGGGYVLAPIHNVQAGVPVENVVAMFRAAREHGAYG